MGTHWKEPDYKYRNLEQLFFKYDEILEDNKENCFYEIYFDETYLIYGLILVSLQNYINQNCKDFLDSKFFDKESKSDYYRVCSKEVENDVTQIQLIIHLANYFKHSDDDTMLHDYTFLCLEDVGLIKKPTTKGLDLKKRKKIELDQRDEARYEYTVILDGIDKISPLEQPMSKLLEIVKKWREDIWKYHYSESIIEK